MKNFDMKTMKFGEVPMYNIFITKPSNALFIKIGNGSPYNAAFLNDRCPTWFPEHRIVHFVDDEHILVVKNRCE